MEKKRMTKKDIPQEIIDEILRPGYAPLELGYRQYNEDYMLVNTYIRFPHATGKMIEWWFSNGLTNTQSYKFWHPGHTAFEWDDKKKPNTFVDATHLSKEMLRGREQEAYMHFCDTADIFDMEQLRKAGYSGAVCGEASDPEGNIVTVQLHMARDTYFGCELRNRFFMYHFTPEMAQDVILHCLHEFCNLSEFLPSLYKRENYLPCHNGEW